MGPINPGQVAMDAAVILGLAKLLENPDALRELRARAEAAREAEQAAQAATAQAGKNVAEATRLMAQADERIAEANTKMEAAKRQETLSQNERKELMRDRQKLEREVQLLGERVTEFNSTCATRRAELNALAIRLEQKSFELLGREKALNERDETLRAIIAPKE